MCSTFIVESLDGFFFSTKIGIKDGHDRSTGGCFQFLRGSGVFGGEGVGILRLPEIFQAQVIFVQGVDARHLATVLVDVCGTESAQDGEKFWKQGVECRLFSLFGFHERFEACVVFEEVILAGVEKGFAPWFVCRPLFSVGVKVGDDDVFICFVGGGVDEKGVVDFRLQKGVERSPGLFEFLEDVVGMEVRNTDAVGGEGVLDAVSHACVVVDGEGRCCFVSTTAIDSGQSLNGVGVLKAFGQEESAEVGFVKAYLILVSKAKDEGEDGGGSGGRFEFSGCEVSEFWSSFEGSEDGFGLKIVEALGEEGVIDGFFGVVGIGEKTKSFEFRKCVELFFGELDGARKGDEGHTLDGGRDGYSGGALFLDVVLEEVVV